MCDGDGLLRCRGKSAAGQIFRATFGDDNIVFDPDAAKLSQAIDALPVDIARYVTVFQLCEQSVYEIDAGFDRQYLALLPRSHESQVRKAGVACNLQTRRVGHCSTELMHLDTQKVSEPVWKK